MRIRIFDRQKENKSTIFCGPFTPPLKAGQTFKIAPMLDICANESKVNQSVIILDKHQGYSGVYTNKLSACVAIAILERDQIKNAINRILMVHFSGGIDEESIIFLKTQLEKHSFSRKLECIVCGGTNYIKEGYTREFFLREAEENIQNYLKDYFDKGDNIIYTASPTICVTFDGYAGGFFFNGSGFPSLSTQDYVVPDVSDDEEYVLSVAINMIESYQNDDNPEFVAAMQSTQEAIEDENDRFGFSTTEKMQLCKATREWIIKTMYQFQNDSENQQKSYHDYVEKINEILGCKKADAFIAAIPKLTMQDKIKTIGYHP